MAKEKFYSEEELIEKYQNGDFNVLDVINHHSSEMKTEYSDFCKQHGLSIDENSAEQFLDYRNEQFNKALENGDA